MTTKQIVDLLEGKARLENLGNLYEFIGMERNKYVFQSVNDDSYIVVSENFTENPDYSIQY